jgi:hypothetical protein
MHIQTHILSGWCIGNLFKLNPKERFLCMLAASLPDLDGLGIIFGQDAYWKYHHWLGHNLLFGLLISLILACLSSSRMKALAIYFILFNVHMLMDYWGSGPLWELYYLWPFSNHNFVNPHAWPLSSWQNITAGVILIIWTIYIIIRKQRTPLEFLMPSLDRQLVEKFLKWFKVIKKEETRNV